MFDMVKHKSRSILTNDCTDFEFTRSIWQIFFLIYSILKISIRIFQRTKIYFLFNIQSNLFITNDLEVFSKQNCSRFPQQLIKDH